LMIRQAWLTLQQHTTLPQRLPGECAEKQVEFQKHVIKLRNQPKYIPSHIGNADHTLVHYNMPWNVTVGEKGTKIISDADIDCSGSRRAQMGDFDFVKSATFQCLLSLQIYFKIFLYCATCSSNSLLN
jgi:hypothetical protein